MPDILAPLKSDPRYRLLSVPDQIATATAVMDAKLARDAGFQAMRPEEQQYVRKAILAQAPTFDNPDTEAKAKATGIGYIQGAAGDENAKNVYEFVHGLIRGSGILSGLDALFDPGSGPSDGQRVLDYYKQLDRLQNKGSGWATAGEFIGNTAEMVAISVALTPLSSALSKAATFGLRGGEAALKAVETAKAAEGIASTGRAALTAIHPALEMTSKVAADALVTAAPLYLADEMKRAAAGEPSIAIQGAGAVLQTLGANAAGNFVWGTVQGGLLMAAARFGKAIFTLKPSGMAKAMERAYADNEAAMKGFIAERDPIYLSKMTPYEQAFTKQLANVLDLADKADPDLFPLAKAQRLAHDTGHVIERTDTGIYRVWKQGDAGLPESVDFTSLNDATNDIAYKAYTHYQKLPDAEKATFTDEHSKWFIDRGMVLENQGARLKANDATKVDLKLGEADQLGFEVKSPKERIVMTRAEADGILKQNDPINGVVIQTKKPLAEVSANAREGEFNLFKGKGPVRVSPDPDPNMVFIGTRGATTEQYAAVTQKATEAIGKDTSFSLEEARASLMLDHGIDYYMHPDGSVEFFTPRNGKLLGTAEDVIASIGRNAKRTGPNSASAIILEATGKLKLKAKDFVGNPELVTKAAMQAIRSKDAKTMEDFVGIYLEGFGKRATIQTFTSTDVFKTPIAEINKDTIRIYVPTNDLTLGEERRYIAALFDKLKVAASDTKGVHKGDFFAQKFDKMIQKPAPFKFGLSRDIDATAWLSDVASKLGGSYEPPKAFQMRLSGGRINLPDGPHDFNSIDDAVNFIARKAADPNMLASELLMEGVGLKKTTQGLTAYSLSTGKALAAGTDHFDLMQKMGLYPKFLDSKYGPSNIRYVDGKVEFTIAGQKIVQSPAEAGEALKQFRDTNLLARQSWLRVKNGAELSVDPVNNYRVYLSKFDYVKNFDNINDARVFFEREVPTWNHLKDIADKKNMDLTIDGGRYKLRVGDATMWADDVDELAEKMRAIPDLEERAPNILDELDPSIEADVAAVVNSFQKAKKLQAGRNKFNQPPQFAMDPQAKQMNAWMVYRSSVSQFTSWIRDVCNRTNRPELLKHVNQLMDGRRLAEVGARKGQQIIIDAFTVKGKLMPEASRQKIFYHMGMQNSDEAAKALGIQYTEKFHKVLEPLTPVEQEAMGKVDNFLKGLSMKFGFEYKDLIFKYMPMIRDFNSPKNYGVLNKLDLADDLAYTVFHGDPPKSIKFWAQNERTNSIFEYTVKDDPLELLMLYNTQGHKKLYMDEAWRKIAGYIENDPAADVALKNRINVFRESIMGYYHSPGEKVVEEFGIRFFKGLKRAPIVGGMLKNVTDTQLEQMGKNILRNTMSLTYLSQLGFKPWTAIRNSMQCLTTLAPRFGLTRALKAYDAVLKEGDGFFDALRMRGIIVDAPPIVDEIATPLSKLGKVTDASMKWLKNGDDLSRAVAYKSGSDAFQDGLDWLAVHPQDIDGFQRISGLSIIDPMNRKALTEMVLKGNKDAAKDSFAAMVEKDTAFTNDGAESSMLRHGLVGKLFGQYGSYSESYRANMFNMLKYGTAADRVRMVGTYLAICAAMTAAFSEMGIKTNDFLPVGPGIFTGGPNFQLAVTAIKSPQLVMDWAAGQWNPSDQLTLSTLKQQLGSADRLQFQARYFQKAAQYYQQGDSWRGWLSLTGVPTTPAD